MSDLRTKESLFNEKFPELSWPSQAPCKHLLPNYFIADDATATQNAECLETGYSLTGTSNLMVVTKHNYSTEVSSRMTGSLTDVPVDGYGPDDADDIIVFFSVLAGTSGGVALKDSTSNNKGFQLLTSINESFIFGQSMGSNNFTFPASASNYYAVVWKAATATLEAYTFADADATAEASLVSTQVISHTIDWTGVNWFYDTFTAPAGAGLGLWAFANGSLPDDYEDQLEFINVNWRKSMRISPEGWGRNT